MLLRRQHCLCTEQPAQCCASERLWKLRFVGYTCQEVIWGRVLSTPKLVLHSASYKSTL